MAERCCEGAISEMRTGGRSSDVQRYAILEWYETQCGALRLEIAIPPRRGLVQPQFKHRECNYW